jgi:hypothetical protein
MNRAPPRVALEGHLMMYGWKTLRIATALAVAATGLAACGPNGSPRAGVASIADKPVSGAGAESRIHACVVAGAEAFEVLTEHAALMPLADLNTEAKAAVSLAKTCQSSLSADQASELSQIIGKVGEFAANQDRVRLALNAVEGYRVLVSSLVRGPADTPLGVALLDYAGFRYQASVSAPAPLWNEAKLAMEFADQQWRTLSSSVSDIQLRAAVTSDLEAMRRAMEISDAPAAQRAATNELDRVDALEAHFSHHPAG